MAMLGPWAVCWQAVGVAVKRQSFALPGLLAGCLLCRNGEKWFQRSAMRSIDLDHSWEHPLGDSLFFLAIFSLSSAAGIVVSTGLSVVVLFSGFLFPFLD